MNNLEDIDEQVEPLHLDFEDREVYLAKVPPALATAWKNVQESELMLGSIKLEKGAVLGKRKGVLTVNPAPLEEGAQTEYRIEIGETPLKLRVFSQDGSGRMAIEGTVKNSCTIMAQRNDQYSKVLKQRLIKAMVKPRITQQLEGLPTVKKAKIQFTIEKTEEEAEDDTVDSKLAFDKSDKKIKMSKDELKNTVFHHFEEREYWPLKELNYHCRQPETFLKEVLKEICVYHRKGPNKSCYELKPQYKNSRA